MRTTSTGELIVEAAPDAPHAELRRPWTIEVLASPLATMHNRTLDKTYGKAHNGTTWVQCMLEARDGDLIEISPGAINQSEADTLNYYSNNLDSCGMTILKGVTIRNMPGRGRWRLYPARTTFASNRNGIGIFSPLDGGDISGRLTISIEGFDLTDQFGPFGVGVRMRSRDFGNWSGYHSSVTFRNFKVGKTTEASLSGFSGAAEVLLLEDGHVFDCGNGSGQEHNLYISARRMSLLGLRSSRTRGWAGIPWGGGTTRVEGHMAKLDAVSGLIEGCCFDAAPLADHSLMTQMKSGGNWVIRSNLYIDSQYPNVANGMVNMCREMSADGTVPNYKPWNAGSEGNSLLVEKNVFIGHYPRPIVWFFPAGHTFALQPAVGGDYPASQRLASLIVRDNIAMVAGQGATAGADQWKLAGWSSQDEATKPMWIYRDPNAGPSWGARGNAVVPYGIDAPGFQDKELLRYRRSAGPLQASGSVTTRRFVFPHGHEGRTDAHQGLG